MWTNIPATGGAQRTVTVTTNSTYTVGRPPWLNLEWVSNGFRLTAQANNGVARSGTVTVRSGSLERSFSVNQLAGAPNLVNITWSNPWGNSIPPWIGVESGLTIRQTGREIPTATRSGYQFIGWSSRPAPLGLGHYEHYGEQNGYGQGMPFVSPLDIYWQPDIGLNFRIPSHDATFRSIMLPTNISVTVHPATYWDQGSPRIWRPQANGGNTSFTVTVSPPSAVDSVDIVTPAFWLSHTATRNASTGVINVTVTAQANNSNVDNRFGTIVVRTQYGQDDFVVEVRQAIDPFFAFYGQLGWEFPLRHPDSRFISSGFKLPNRSDHEGIDIQRYNPGSNPPSSVSGGIMGEQVFAAHDGMVVLGQWSTTAGYWVVIRSDVIDASTNNFIVSRYLHMRYRPLVSSGRIARGTQIGNVGNTGHTLGGAPGGISWGHLHLDINNNNRYSSSGVVRPYAINPQRFFPDINFVGQTSTRTN